MKNLWQNKTYFKISLWFLIFIVFLICFYIFIHSFSYKSVKISSSFLNKTKQTYIWSWSIISPWDEIERVILVKNESIFSVNNYEIKDKNPFNWKVFQKKISIKPLSIDIWLKYDFVFDWKNQKIIKWENFDMIDFWEDISSINHNYENQIKLKIENQDEKLDDYVQINWISKTEIDNDFDEYVEIETNKTSFVLDNAIVKCKEKIFEYKIFKLSSSKFFFQIDAMSLDIWNCFFWIRANQKDYFYEKNISVDKSWLDIDIKNIIPNIATTRNWWVFVLQWKWFDKVVWIQINNSIIIPKKNIEIVSPNVLKVKVPEWLTQWDYFFRFMTKNNILDISNKNFIIIKN